MFPTLITGYTDEGTAILSLKGNVEQLRDAYKEAQQEAYNLLVATGNDSYGNDIMESYKNLSELDWWDSSIGAEDVTTTVKRDITKQILDLMSNMDTAVEEYDKLAQTIFDTYGDKGYNFLEEMGLPAIKDVFSYTSGITEEALIAGRATVQSYYQGFQSEIDTKLSKVKLMANAFLNTNDFYLDDSTNSELKNALSVMVNSINEELANSFNGEQVKVGAYVNNIVNSIKGNEEVQKELIDLFTIDTTDMPVSDIVEQINGYINSISIAINEDPEELKVRLGFDYVDDLESHYQRAVDFTKNKFDGYDATAFFKEHSINTQEEIDAWQKIAQGAKDAAEAEKEYIQGSTSNIEPTISSFENAWASLATTDNDSLKSLKDDLLELAEAGQLTFETFNETEGSGDFLAQLGLTSDNISDVEDIIKKINELKSSADQLASMKKGISPLSENLYNKQQEPEKEISVDVFAGMDEGLKKQKKEWENYVTVLGNASSSTEAVQNATNELATAYVNSNNFLANLTAANKDYYTSQLSAMGVENAEEVVTASLSAQKEILAIKEQALAVTKDGVTASTAGEINALLNEANASETTRAYLFQLTAAEQVFNNQSLDTSGKIRALGELATAYGQTAIAAKIAAWEQAAADSHTQSSYSEADLKHLQEEMNANINSTKIDVNAYAGSAKSGGSGSGKSGNSGSSAKEESIETFDFIETAVKRIEAAIERLKTKAEETFRSFTSRGREYKKAISEITKEIEIQRQGYDAYIAKANSIGLEESWAAQVRDGSINIADVSDDGLKERIKNYKEWWNHATLFSNG